MAKSFLHGLPLSDEEKVKLQSLGAETPAALVGMMKASPDSFHRLLGPERAAEIRTHLERLISPDERAVLEAPVPAFHARGAIVDKPAPPIDSPKYDLEERERLFTELRELRSRGDASPEAQRRAS